MKRISRMLGVTLLEIMLVLAVAAMVIVMSVRYYQTASMAQQVNSVMSQIQAITATMDNLAAGPGTGYTNITTDIVIQALGNRLTTPWNTEITAPEGTPTATTYQVSIPTIDPAACAMLETRVASSGPSFNTVAPACEGNTLTYTYSSVATTAVP